MKGVTMKINPIIKVPDFGQSIWLDNLRRDLLESNQLKKIADQDYSRRLWEKDCSLWTNTPEVEKQIQNALGWLHVAEKMITNVPDLKNFAESVRKEGFTHVVHMGMGGSSLAPYVFNEILADDKNGLALTILDTTEPQTIARLEKRIPLKNTLFIVASKSGTTTEAVSFMDYFYHRLKDLKGNSAGDNFVVITDPESPLVKTAEQRRFRKTFLNFKDIGGRYSALSYFGLVPAVLAGVDIKELLERAIQMVHANQHFKKSENNPAVILGATIGELVLQGKDKLTFLTSDSMSSFGLWLEQLIAESTGKNNKGILPVALENIGDPELYGQDRIFVYFDYRDNSNEIIRKQLQGLTDAGYPLITINMRDRYDIGREIIRWEIATAIAGAVIHINPFDQPNVQESKDNTTRILQKITDNGSLPPVTLQNGNEYSDILLDIEDDAFEEKLKHFLQFVKPGDYLALQAYIEEQPLSFEIIQKIRYEIRDFMQIATTVGYGPRFLHSTGQFHKGGPNTGLFIQLTGEMSTDIDIPERGYSFGTLLKAQAQGDLEALQKHNRRVVQIQLGKNIEQGLRNILNAVFEVIHEAV